MNQAVERRQQRGAVGDRLVVRLRVRMPLAALESDAERPEALLGEPPPGLANRHRLRGRIPPLCDVPEPLAAVAAGDRDVSAALEQLEHL